MQLQTLLQFCTQSHPSETPQQSKWLWIFKAVLY